MRLAERRGRTVIFGFGRVGRIVADMLRDTAEHYLAIDSDVDAVRKAATRRAMTCCSATSPRPELIERLQARPCRARSS